MVKLQLDILDNLDLKTFSIIDNSLYDSSIVLSKATLTVQVPGFLSEVKHVLKKNEIITFNSNNLGITNVSNCEEEFSILPDGLYIITYTASNNSTLDDYCTSISYYRVAFLNSLLDEAIAIATKNSMCSKERMDELKEVEFFLNGVSSNANIGEFEIAEKMYDHTKKLLEKYLKRC